MSEKQKVTVWLIGTGLMSIEYAKVLKALDKPFVVIGRGQASADNFVRETGIQPIVGGLTNFLEHVDYKPEKVIVAVGIESLAEICASLIGFGAEEILLEKPGFAYPDELTDLLRLKKNSATKIFLAYNRRFYASVRKAKEMIEEDGGVSSFTFEFTEWSHVIKNLKKNKAEHQTWFLGNSTHVIDTAFYIAGKPIELSVYVKGTLDWHPSSSIFVGAGVSQGGAFFSYHANWEAPGRWGIELLTKNHRFILKPLEILQIQKNGSINIEKLEINDELDIKFKPGLLLQTKSFLDNDFNSFCTIDEQKMMVDNFYLKMANY